MAKGNDKDPKVTKKTVTTKIQYNLKTTKEDKIALQNLLFGTAEKKLMVSDEFLNNMALRYISKRMKLVNLNVDGMSKTKSATVFFKYSDEIVQCLDELIVLEPYYIFNKPVPTVFKKNFLEHRPSLEMNMLRRAWKSVLQKVPIEDPISEAKMAVYDEVIDEMRKYIDQMAPDSVELVESFRKRVHGDEELPEEDLSDDELVLSDDELDGEALEGLDAAGDGEDGDDGFQELKFEEA